MKKFIALLMAVVLVLSLAPTTYAVGAIGNVEEFESIQGNGAYINDEYRDNYYLDIMELGIFDTFTAGANGLANLLFSLEKWIVHMTCTVFYYATSVNLAEIFDVQTNEIQKSLKEQVFDSMFPLMLAFSGMWIAWMMLKRNSQEIINQIVKIILIVTCASLVIVHSSSVVAMVDGVTSSVSNSVMSGMTMQEDGGKNYGVTTAGTLWETLIHEPWLTLEFGNYEPENKQDTIEKILSNAPLSKDRQEKIINKMVGDNPDEPEAFGKDMPMKRLPLIILYLVPLLVKCAIYAAIALLQLSFRVITILLVFIGILILMLSLVPQLGGTQLIVKWVKKIAEMQIMIVVLTFMLGFLMMIDKMLYTKVNQWGWLTVIIIQTVLAVVIFLFRDKILGFFNKVQKTVQNPAMVATQVQNQLDSMGNAFSAAQLRTKSAAEDRKKVGNIASGIDFGIRTKIGETIDGLKDVGSYYHPNLENDDIESRQQQVERAPIERPTLQQPTVEASTVSNMDAVKGRGASSRLNVVGEETTPIGIAETERPILVKQIAKDDTEPNRKDTIQELERPTLKRTAEQQKSTPGYSANAANYTAANGAAEQPKRPVLVMQDLQQSEINAEGIALNAPEKTATAERMPQRPILQAQQAQQNVDTASLKMDTPQAMATAENMPRPTLKEQPPITNDRAAVPQQRPQTAEAPQKRPVVQSDNTTANIKDEPSTVQTEPRKAATTANLELGDNTQHIDIQTRQTKVQRPVLQKPVKQTTPPPPTAEPVHQPEVNEQLQQKQTVSPTELKQS